MLPFPIVNQYGNTVVKKEFYIGYNFDTMLNYGEKSVSFNMLSGTGVRTSVPLQYTGYSNMYRLTNSTMQMLLDTDLNIGTKNFECSLIFYLYTGTSYDYIMNFNNDSSETSLLTYRIGDSGLGNRFQFIAGDSGTSNRISCNKTRTDLTSQVNKITIRRENGVMTSYLNGTQMLMGSWTNPSTASTVANNYNIQVHNYYFGEYQGTSKFASDIGYLDFNIKFF